MNVNLVKGTHDIFGEEINFYQIIKKTFISLFKNYGYNEFSTPILEYQELFKRNENDSSDMVRKQMYIFHDLSNRNLVLRPEGTAGVARCVVNNKLYNNINPIKAFYFGPVFRYEQPKKGTYRQFTQFGVENISTDSIYNDVETIILSYRALEKIGLKQFKLKINSLGDELTQKKYCQILKKYFNPFIKNMCSDCQKRILINPLRMLDCKNKQDKKIINKAPKINSYLNQKSKERFKKTLELLKKLNIKYEIDEKLVRGLDYYSHTVYEYEYITKKGLNIGAIGGGGHYDKLISELNGPNLSGVGFAFGLERIYNILKEDGLLPISKNKNFNFIVIPISNNDNVIKQVFFITDYLRKIGFCADCILEKKSLTSMFHQAEKKRATFAILIGEKEIKNKKLTIKNLQNQQQEEILSKNLKKYCLKLFNNNNEKK